MFAEKSLAKRMEGLAPSIFMTLMDGLSQEECKRWSNKDVLLYFMKLDDI